MLLLAPNLNSPLLHPKIVNQDSFAASLFFMGSVPLLTQITKSHWHRYLVAAESRDVKSEDTIEIATESLFEFEKAQTSELPYQTTSIVW